MQDTRSNLEQEVETDTIETDEVWQSMSVANIYSHVQKIKTHIDLIIREDASQIAVLPDILEIAFSRIHAVHLVSFILFSMILNTERLNKLMVSWMRMHRSPFATTKAPALMSDYIRAMFAMFQTQDLSFTFRQHSDTAYDLHLFSNDMTPIVVSRDMMTIPETMALRQLIIRTAKTGCATAWGKSSESTTVSGQREFSGFLFSGLFSPTSALGTILRTNLIMRTCLTMYAGIEVQINSPIERQKREHFIRLLMTVCDQEIDERYSRQQRNMFRKVQITPERLTEKMRKFKKDAGELKKLSVLIEFTGANFGTENNSCASSSTIKEGTEDRQLSAVNTSTEIVKAAASQLQIRPQMVEKYSGMTSHEIAEIAIKKTQEANKMQDALDLYKDNDTMTFDYSEVVQMDAHEDQQKRFETEQRIIIPSIKSARNVMELCTDRAYRSEVDEDEEHDTRNTKRKNRFIDADAHEYSREKRPRMPRDLKYMVIDPEGVVTEETLDAVQAEENAQMHLRTAMFDIERNMDDKNFRDIGQNCRVYGNKLHSTKRSVETHQENISPVFVSAARSVSSFDDMLFLLVHGRPRKSDESLFVNPVVVLEKLPPNTPKHLVPHILSNHSTNFYY